MLAAGTWAGTADWSWMMADDRAFREQLVKLLDSKEAHATFDAAVEGVALKMLGVVPRGWEYSIWQLVEHIRIAQEDILDFSVNPKYHERKWPDEYWPKARAPRSGADWRRSLEDYRKDLDGMKRLTRDTPDLAAAISHGTGQTYLREILLVADHTAYHVGQIVALRRQLGIWK
jgi:DinB family protein